MRRTTVGKVANKVGSGSMKKIGRVVFRCYQTGIDAPGQFLYRFSNLSYNPSICLVMVVAL